MTLDLFFKICYERPLRINTPYKWITAGTVCKAVDKSGPHLILDGLGHYPIKSVEDVTFLDEVEQKDIEPGDEVTLTQSCNSFQTGTKIIVKDFLDKEKTKILTNGLMPGGWINAKHVSIMPKAEGWRLKSYHEMFHEFGYNFGRVFNLSSSMMDRLGKPIDSASVRPSYGRGAYEFTPISSRFLLIITTHEPENDNLKLYIKSEKDICQYFEFFGDNKSDFSKLLKNADKPLRDLLPDDYGKPDRRLINDITANSRMPIKDGLMLIRPAYITCK